MGGLTVPFRGEHPAISLPADVQLTQRTVAETSVPSSLVQYVLAAASFGFILVTGQEPEAYA